MDLTLNDGEIKEAIVNYVSANGVNTSGKRVDVTIVTGRKNSGSKAEVVISDADANEVPAQEAEAEGSTEVSNKESTDSTESTETTTADSGEASGSLFDPDSDDD